MLDGEKKMTTFSQWSFPRLPAWKTTLIQRLGKKKNLKTQINEISFSKVPLSIQHFKYMWASLVARLAKNPEF